jgi:hypothetical protein
LLRIWHSFSTFAPASFFVLNISCSSCLSCCTAHTPTHGKFTVSCSALSFRSNQIPSIFKSFLYGPDYSFT